MLVITKGLSKKIQGFENEEAPSSALATLGEDAVTEPKKAGKKK